MKRRKVEVHRLTISGLEEDASYADFLKSTHEHFGSPSERTLRTATKSHLWWDCKVRSDGRVRLTFLSFAKGFRPDILDTDEYELSDSPLEESETGVEWTHCLGGHFGERFLLLIEKHQGGIWPKSLEHYLNWLIWESGQGPADDHEEGITATVEAEPGEAFIKRLDSLTRIKSATYRIARPNPGWSDLDSELGEQAADSKAHRADITMTAVARGTLNKLKGIVKAIKDRFRTNELDFARIVGERDGTEDAFDTERLGKRSYVNLKTDSRGQIEHSDAWRKLNGLFDELD